MDTLEAKIVNEHLFDDPLFSTLKELTVEELLTKSIEIIDGLNMKTLADKDFKNVSLVKFKIKGELQQQLLFIGEIIRRDIDITGAHSSTLVNYFHNINTFIEDKCQIYGEKKDYLDLREFSLHNIIKATNVTNVQLRTSFEDKIRYIKMVKETMLKILKGPLLTKELETCMDEILDLNGNKISQMKEYLTEEQYRFVRSGAKFDELEGQQDMLNRMNKMLEVLKRCAIGEEVLEVPVARRIQHLKNEFASYKTSQKEYEKDLEKLKCKI